ncbi:MAG TPA: inorganic diphosphatase [Mycobacteriales bacterium]|nr:inorganic diphosphatase [Mycobacteriales bacterium]
MTDTPLVDVVVEIPRGSRNKYEFDEDLGVMRFDRRLLGSIAFPADYGFVPKTVGEDGDALDALVLLDEPTYPGIWVTCRTVGVSWIGTERGREAKLLCVPEGDPAYDDVHDLEDLPPHVRREVGHFFEVYKALDDASSVTDEGQEGAAVARRVLAQAQQRYREEQPS